MSLAVVGSLLAEQERKVATERGRLLQLQSDIDALRAEEAELSLSVDQLSKVVGVFQKMEESWQKSFEARLGALVSRGLSVVFGEHLEFRLISGTKRDVSSMEFKLVQLVDGEELETDILDAKGGGVVAVAGFLLRVLLMIAYRPQLRPVMLLDETFAHLSSEYIPNLAQLISQLHAETGIQFILVTHDQTFVEYADVAYESSQKAGATSFRLLKQHREHICD